MSTVAPDTGVNTGGPTDGILNVLEVVPVIPDAVNVIVAPVTPAELVAVKFVNVATPPDADTVVVPPRV